jgi:hypothetical protein
VNYKNIKNYDNITVVAIYGNGEGLKAVPAINKTAECLPGARKLLITDRTLPTDIPQKLTAAQFDHAGYSKFCMYSLGKFIETDYALIVQHDGWALNAENWRDQWLEYDYIGGLTHAALVTNALITNYQWVGLDNALVVQNGGFSLRSKRFMNALTDYGIMPIDHQNPMLNNEDIQLTTFLRKTLEKVGIKFAPDEEAQLFSFEHLCPGIHDGKLHKIFGHHSRFRTLLGENKMLWHLTSEQTDAMPMERMAYDLFRYYDYQMIN